MTAEELIEEIKAEELKPVSKEFMNPPEEEGVQQALFGSEGK